MRIRDIATIASCTLPKQDTVWLLNLDAVEQQTGKVIEYKYVSPDMLTGSTTAFDTNTVLYSKLRPNLNKVVVPTMSGYATSEMLPLRPDVQKCTREYLAFYLRSNAFVEWAISKTNGAKMPRLGTKDLLDKEIPVPSIQTQKHIVAVFACVESLIDELSRMLSHFDELVKSRFIEMFGDPATNPFKHPVRLLSDVAEYYNGLTYKPEDVSETGTVVLRSSNIQNSALDFADTVRVVCPVKQRMYVQDKDILMCSRNGSAKLVGKVALIHNLPEKMSFGAFMMIIRSKYSPYLFTYFQMDAFREQIRTGATTTINQITGRMLDGITLPVPPMEEIAVFADFVAQTDKSKVEIQNALNELEILKKSLMQQYFG